MVADSGDRPGSAGSTINYETDDFPGLPDKHGISFVLSDLPIFIHFSEKAGKQTIAGERKKRPNMTCEGGE